MPMRRSFTHAIVATLIREAFPEDPDVVRKLLHDLEVATGDFAQFCQRLADQAPLVVTLVAMWNDIVSRVDEDLKTKIVTGEIANPALHLASMIRPVSSTTPCDQADAPTSSRRAGRPPNPATHMPLRRPRTPSSA